MLDVSVRPDQFRFEYGPGVVGPVTEFRSLDAIRGSLLDPLCQGPDPVYGIAMDVARESDLPSLQQRMLLYGIVVYAAGRLGQEPVRSQGHVHAIAPHSGWSPPELFEILKGRAIVYAQKTTDLDPGACVAVFANPGDKVVVPPGWAHCVINADPANRMVFGAWCDRQYGFVYDGVRAHGGLAWFPVLTSDDRIEWRANPTYRTEKLTIHAARPYPELDLLPDCDIYRQFVDNPESLMWISDPARKLSIWSDFLP
ncbi:MAG: glucose-6-phosphate isomerase family protein [Acidobacteriaceae bacterium]